MEILIQNGANVNLSLSKDFRRQHELSLNQSFSNKDFLVRDRDSIANSVLFIINSIYFTH